MVSIDPERFRAIEEALHELERLDPKEVPQPAADLADLLSELLEEMGPGE